VNRGARELEEEPSVVEMIDTEFENSPSRITILRDFPETRIVEFWDPIESGMK